jgi:hypothetical protein
MLVLPCCQFPALVLVHFASCVSTCPDPVHLEHSLPALRVVAGSGFAFRAGSGSATISEFDLVFLRRMEPTEKEAQEGEAHSLQFDERTCHTNTHTHARVFVNDSNTLWHTA